MNTIKELGVSLLQMVFPHVCEGCGSDLPGKQNMLCMKCSASLPETNFHLHYSNPVEKLFWGRLPITVATSQYYFTKESMMQHLMHLIKYSSNKDLAIYMGRLMGFAFQNSNRFNHLDALVPLPLHPAKEKKRGYNQATLLCKGIAEVIKTPIIDNAIIRGQFTKTQTRKTRIERWHNMDGKFNLSKPDLLSNKHILLVDDVITTGATLEACGHELLKVPGLLLSLASLCYSGK